MYAITQDYNIRAQRCLRKSGFRLDEVLAHEPTAKGKSEYCFAISREEYYDAHADSKENQG